MNKQRKRDFGRKKPQSETGIIRINSKGIGFLSAGDLIVENKDLNTALDGDTVEYSIQKRKVRITKIVKRARDRFVGVLKLQDGQLYLIPDNPRIYTNFKIKEKVIPLPESNTKALIQMLPWNKSTDIPMAKILKIIGQAGQHETEIQSIILAKGFDLDYPDDVNREAKEVASIAFPIPQEEIAKRRDMRDVLTCTIDPADAKDFDDAISFRELPNDEIEIGVHIADVSHYVRPGSALDRESFERQFSMYLVDRTVPMLPLELSNNVCSLNPNEDRLAFSVIFVIDKKDNIKSQWFGKTVIHSDKRFSYEEAQKTIVGDKNTKWYKELNILNAYSKRLREEKLKQGAIDFDTEEVKVEMDKDNKPVRIYKKPRLDTHKLIEELMLLANRSVAEYLFNKNKSLQNQLMYRTHEPPSPEKFNDISIFLRALGHMLPIRKDGTVSPKDINALLQKVEGKAEEGLVKTAMVRTMSKAIYSVENTGHFGLAFEYYTHFTSPIRRYPDLIVHRILEAYLDEYKPSGRELSHFREVAEHATEREISIAEAERESIKYKQAEYMLERIGTVCEGVISGVTEWGIYVEDKETKSEGLAHIRTLGEERFEFNERQYALIGQKSGKKYTLGDKIRFSIKKVDVERKQIDVEIV